jgi:hypothetical protein
LQLQEESEQLQEESEQLQEEREQLQSEQQQEEREQLSVERVQQAEKGIEHDPLLLGGGVKGKLKGIVDNKILEINTNN